MKEVHTKQMEHLTDGDFVSEDIKITLSEIFPEDRGTDFITCVQNRWTKKCRSSLHCSDQGLI